MAVIVKLLNHLHFPPKRSLYLSISLLFFLNFLYLLTYFHNHNHNHNYHALFSTSSKPWPTLPPYLPGTPPSTSSSSCESYFGNGFARISVSGQPEPEPGPHSWFRCNYNSALRSSVCGGGRVLMDPGKIRMSNGGERIEEVTGRLDEEELPVFEPGAFRLRSRNAKRNEPLKRAVSKAFLDEYVPQGKVTRHTMRKLFENMELVGDDDFHCNEQRQQQAI